MWKGKETLAKNGKPRGVGKTATNEPWMAIKPQVNVIFVFGINGA